MCRTFLFAAALLTTLSATSAADIRSQTFHDWQATCLPDGGCTASTGDHGAPATGETLRLIVERTGTNSLGWYIAVEFQQKPARADRAITLSIPNGPKMVLSADGGFHAYHKKERLYVTDPGILRRLLPAMLAGNAITVDYFDVTNEARQFSLSLSGITASLLWIENELKIVGAPRIAVLPADLPAAVPSQISPVAGAGVPEAVLAYHERTSDCEQYDEQRMNALGYFIEPLSNTAILYALPCTAHAYNVTYRLYLRQIGEIGGVRTLYLADYADTTNWSGTDLLFNINVDGRNLSAFYKGRGLGDCGTWGEWTWQDHNYRLERYAAQSSCQGILSENWPIVFPQR